MTDANKRAVISKGSLRKEPNRLIDGSGANFHQNLRYIIWQNTTMIILTSFILCGLDSLFSNPNIVVMSIFMSKTYIDSEGKLN